MAMQAGSGGRCGWWWSQRSRCWCSAARLSTRPRSGGSGPPHVVSPDATTRTPPLCLSLPPSPSQLRTHPPSPTYVRTHRADICPGGAVGSVQPPRTICVVVHPPAARPPCRPAPFPGHPSGVRRSLRAPPEAAVRSDSAESGACGRLFRLGRARRLHPSSAPHTTVQPTTSQEAAASAAQPHLVAAPEPRGEHASCARAAPNVLGSAESHARGCHGDVLRLRVRPRLGRRRGRPGRQVSRSSSRWCSSRNLARIEPARQMCIGVRRRASLRTRVTRRPAPACPT